MGAMVMYGCANNTVHVYQAISAEAFLDSGANVSIFTLDNEPHMTDKVASKLSVTGFSGKDLEGKSDGMAKMYIFDPNHPGDGHHIMLMFQPLQ